MSTQIINLPREEIEYDYSKAISEIREINRYRGVYNEIRKILNKHHKDTLNKEIRPYIKRAIENLELIIDIFDKNKPQLVKKTKELENIMSLKLSLLMNMEEIN